MIDKKATKEKECCAMIKLGERVECTDKKSSHFGKQGAFIGFLANGIKIQFDDGTEGLFLANSLKKL